MALNNFRLMAGGRILLIVLLIAAFFYSLQQGWVLTPVVLLLITIAVTAELVYYVERSNREFTGFLLSVKNSDFSKYNVADKRGRSFSDLKKALNIIVDEFQLARMDKEANHIFLQTVVEHLDTAIISFDESGDIKLINEAAKKLLQIPFLKNIYSLRQMRPDLCDYLTGTHNNNKPVPVLDARGEKLKLSLRSADFKVQGISHKLLAIQNIKAEIEHTELEAWEQLLRVLTHEIMNSITPLSSLSATLKKKTDGLRSENRYDEEAMADLSEGLNVIAKRSVGLVNFVNHYKSVITLPVPVFETIQVKELFERILRFKKEELKEKGIILKLNFPGQPITMYSDPDLTEQVLINLVNNAADALEQKENPVIELSSEIINGKTMLRVSDNGPGIDKDVLDKIFIPFFTTKQKGSGIGLSLSKQIMRLHGGSIDVQSLPGEGTVFTLVF